MTDRLTKIKQEISDAFKRGDVDELDWAFKTLIGSHSQFPRDWLTQVITNNYDKFVEFIEILAKQDIWMLVTKAYNLVKDLGIDTSGLDTIISNRKQQVLRTIEQDIENELILTLIYKLGALVQFGWPEVVDILNHNKTAIVRYLLQTIKEGDTEPKELHKIVKILQSLSLNWPELPIIMKSLVASLNESVSVDQKVNDFKDFILFCKKHLGLKTLPKFRWYATRDNVGNGQPTFGSFHNDDQTISIVINNRHPLDIMRTLAHELCHYKQWLNHELGDNSGETGSPQENEANAEAGIIMRNWGKERRDMFDDKPVEKLDESVEQAIPQEVYDFIESLTSDDVGKERIGDYVIHYEGFSDWCQADAEERCHLPPDDSKHLASYEDVYKEVLNDFIQREDGNKPLDSGLAGDELYPVYFAVFHKPELNEADFNRINQYHEDGGSLEGYVVDTDQPQLENYLTSQGASSALVASIRNRYHRIGIIRNMWVDEEQRGGGIGSDLLGQAIGDAFSFGAEAILLVADMAESNLMPLDQWYGKWGFVKIGSAGGDPVMVLDKSLNESWSDKYKKSINCNSPKGFSQRAHCAGRKARQAGQKTKSKSVSENFADGKGPGRPGDSQRHGIPKGATIAQLEKAAKAPGRKGQLARWQLNMRRGRAKNESKLNENRTVDRIVDRLNHKHIDDALTDLTYAVFRDPDAINPYKRMILEALNARKTEILTYLLSLLKNTTTGNALYIIRPTVRAFRMIGVDWPEIAIIKKSLDAERSSDEIDENLNEGQTVYHSSSVGTISKFNPFSHFGTEKAAADRIKFLIKQKKIKPDTPITVYTVDLNIRKPLMIRDYASIQHSSSEYASELKKKKIIDQDTMVKIRSHDPYSDPINAGKTTDEKRQLWSKYEDENLRQITQILKDAGYDGLVYKNASEDKGSLSYVILDPTQARVTGKEVVPAQELVKRFEVVKENSKLDAPTPTVGELAEKYHTSLLAVKQQLIRGIKIEMEHTTKKSVAREIALDHLSEDLYYYKKLAKIEKK